MKQPRFRIRRNFFPPPILTMFADFLPFVSLALTLYDPPYFTYRGPCTWKLGTARLVRVVASLVFFPPGSTLSVCGELVSRFVFKAHLRSPLARISGLRIARVSLYACSPMIRPGVLHVISLLYNRSALSIPALCMLYLPFFNLPSEPNSVLWPGLPG